MVRSSSQSLEKEAKQVVGEMDKTYRLYLADQVPIDGFGRIYKPLEERKRQLDDEIPRLQAELDVMRIQLLSQDDVLSQARDVYGRWREFTVEERRRIVEAIVDRIVVSKDEVQLELAYQIPPSGNRAKTEENLLPAVPFCALTLKTAKPPYPEGLRTIGDHIRKRRLDLRLRQRDVADLIGVERVTVGGWETMGLRPPPASLEKVVKFLRCEPKSAAKASDLVQKLTALRRRLRLARSEMAEKLGISYGTIWSWEQGRRRPRGRSLSLLMTFLAAHR